MTAATCVVCRRRPVKRRRPGVPVPKRGLRIVDGESWNWFCSKRCAGRDCGRTNIASGRVQVAIERAREARRRHAWERQLAEVADEVRTLMHYGVPRPVAVATLTRLVRRARAQANDAHYHETVRKPRRAAIDGQRD